MTSVDITSQVQCHSFSFSLSLALSFFSSFFSSLFSPSVSFFLISLSFVTLYCVHRTGYFFHSFTLTTMFQYVHMCRVVFTRCSYPNRTSIEEGRKLMLNFERLHLHPINLFLDFLVSIAFLLVTFNAK